MEDSEMHRQRILLPFLLACLSLPIPALSQQIASQKPNRRPDLPVTSTVTDYIDVIDDAGALQRIWMQIRSDGMGSYTNSSDVESIVQGAYGNWYLTTVTSARHIFLDFSKPIPGTGPDGGAPVAPFTSALIGARLVTKCDQYNIDMFNIPAGATVNCPLAILFRDSGNDYMLQMNPLTGIVAPETDYVNVTCDGAANSQCNNWTIVPNGARGGCLTADCSVRQNLTRLYKSVPSSKPGKSGSATSVNQGNFYVSFSVTITNP
jgi:hypothetical protein